VTKLDDGPDTSQSPGLVLGVVLSCIRRVKMASISIDAIIEQVSTAFDRLETFITHTTTEKTPDSGLHASGETTDLFKVWLRNTSVAREECNSYEDCLRNNSELRLTLVELLVDIKDDLAEGKGECDFAVQSPNTDLARTVQPTAPYKPSHQSSDYAEILPLSDPLDTTTIITILADIHAATLCLMRLSKPLFDNHRRHWDPDRYCAEGETHLAQHLQRILRGAEWTALEQLSRSTCARRDILLITNSRRKISDAAALDDITFLRVVLLELASVSGETSSGGEIVPGDEADWNVFRDAEKSGSQIIGRWSTDHVGTPRDPPKKPSSSSQAHRDIVPNASKIMLIESDPVENFRTQLPGDLNRKAYPGDTQKTGKAQLVDSDSSDDTTKPMTMTACTRCRVVSLLKLQCRL
jgi:hypothetical protein